MNINEPTTSRQLSILIEPVLAEERRRFIQDAREAEDMESFMSGLNKYKTIYDLQEGG
jgi:hypothetical protein